VKPLDRSPAAPIAPLAGVRVVDFSSNMAGPYGAMILAQLGADVVKVEPLAGDDARAWPPFVDGLSLTHRFVGAGKRGLALDLKRAGGVEVARALIARADVVLQSMRPGVADRLGIGAEATRALAPDALHYDLSAFGGGPTGRAEPGYDPLVQAFSGIMMMTGHEGGPPTRCAPSLIDLGTGQWIAMGVMAALMARRAGQTVRSIDTALVDTAFAVVPYQASAARLSGERPPKAGSGNPIAAPYQCYRARDGELLIAAPSQRLWEAVVDALDAPALRTDPRFATPVARAEHRAALEVELNARLAADGVDGWIARLRAAGVPVSRVHGLDEATRGAIAEERGTFVESDGVPLVRLPWLFDGAPVAWRSPAPRLGEHTLELLAELGYDDARTRALIDEGAVLAASAD
jgi:crotonobetainyl-CoA:carnitine CoA-transferase CaiB-like acyl-CoA transferase